MVVPLAAGAVVLGISDFPIDIRVPNRWLLLSDTHIPSARDTMRENVNMSDHLARVVRQIADPKELPAGLFVNGDCAYPNGLPGDYALFSELLRPMIDLKVPMHLTLR